MNDNPTPRTSRGRRAIHAVIAVVLALFALETGARLLERARPVPPVDARSPLEFQQIPDQDTHTIEDGRIYIDLALWRGQQLAQSKGLDEFRIVVLGGSAAAGMGVAPPAAFARVMERLLNQAAPGRLVRVINLSRVGYASPQLARILEMIGPVIQPDLVLTVMGNNEFLDMVRGRTPEEIDALLLAREVERRSALTRLFRPRQRLTPIPPGMDTAPRPLDPSQRPEVADYVVRRLGRSVANMKQWARRNGADLMVATVPANKLYGDGSRDWAFAVDGDDLPREFQRARWALRYEAPEKAIEAVAGFGGDDLRGMGARWVTAMALHQLGRDDEALPMVRQLERDLYTLAVVGKGGAGLPNLYGRVLGSLANDFGEAVDLDRAAEPIVRNLPSEGATPTLYFRVGAFWYYAGEGDKAAPLLDYAEETDRTVSRAGAIINEALRRAAADTGARFYDLAGDLAEYSPLGIPGFDAFLDYCHYNVRGNRIAGRLLAGEIARRYGFDGPMPSVGDLLAEEARLRAGRETDLPDLAWWAGADYDVLRLVDEKIDDTPAYFEALEARIAREGPTPLSLTFLGNWKTYHPATQDEATLEAAEKLYRRALELDPKFEAARADLDRVAWIRQ
ncbi:MAG: hypothetical protein H6684_07525 [Deltaproteobacteria bacterium]|nr:hypothetical protein [Deltaproteobacteria bacterium]